jgi:hypothetical protein
VNITPTVTSAGRPVAVLISCPAGGRKAVILMVVMSAP